MAELKEVVEVIRERQARLGPNALRVAWVKAHIGTWGNGLADHLAKQGTTLSEEWEGVDRTATEGGLRQRWKRMRGEEQRVKGAGMSYWFWPPSIASFSNSGLTTSGCPFCTEIKNTISPVSRAASIFAPFSNSSCLTSLWPFAVA